MYKLIYIQDAIDLLTERHCDICPYNDHRHNSQRCNECDYKEAMDDLEDVPSTQPDIIRCKDCKFWTHIKHTDRYWCKTDDGLYDLNPSPDDFCSRAERRTND